MKTLQSVGKEEQIKSAAAQVQTAKAHYESQEAQVAYSRVVSPIAGVVADRPLNEGDIAGPGMPLLTVMDISRVVARVNVPQADAPFVKVGQTAIITQTDNSEQIEGKGHGGESIHGSQHHHRAGLGADRKYRRALEARYHRARCHRYRRVQGRERGSRGRNSAGRRGRHGGAHGHPRLDCAHQGRQTRGPRGQSGADPQRRQSRRRSGGRRGTGCGRQNQGEGGHHRRRRIRRRRSRRAGSAGCQDQKKDGGKQKGK